MTMAAPITADEELAGVVKEEQAPSSELSTEEPTQKSEEKKKSSYCTPFRKMASITLVAAVIAAAASGAFSSSDGTATNSDFDLFDPTTWIPRWLDDNPHGGNTPYDFSLWDTNRMCNGLELHIFNNLEDKWQPYFERSIKEWDEGDPDVLTLNVRRPIWSDPGECEPRNGILKVCNGDFGQTDWIGVNHAVIHSNYILSSVAIMNDYHLEKMGAAAMQNTMCHEIGHGLGLGHWDENFYNRDLHNCMDYTKTPENNQSPDRSNFLFLEQMYGNVDGNSQYYEKNVNGTVGLHCSGTVSSAAEIFKKRKLSTDDAVELTDGEFSKYASLLTPHGVTSDETSEIGQRRLLKRNEHEEVHEQSFPNGVKIVSTYRLHKRHS